jgi:hypothetical protein
MASAWLRGEKGKRRRGEKEEKRMEMHLAQPDRNFKGIITL